MSEGRVPPHDLDAEASVLGGVLLRTDALGGAIEVGLEPESFYHPSHRDVFAAMLALDERSHPIDITTLADELRRAGSMKRGVEGLLAELAARVATAENLAFYAKIVYRKACLRRLIAACTETVGKAFAAAGDEDEICDAGAARVCAAAERADRGGYTLVRKMELGVAQKITARAELRSAVTGVTTGYSDLDELLSGLQPSDLIILAARPSFGKTAFLLNTVLRCGVPSLIFSLEMPKAQLLERLFVSEAQIDGQLLRNGRLDGHGWLAFNQAVARVHEMPICIDDAGSPSLLQIRTRARRWRRDREVWGGRRGLGLIGIDYLQLINDGQQQGESRDRALARLTRGLKGLAKELEVPIVLLSQLNRAVEKRDDQKPILSDLRESGSIEQDADVVEFLHQPPKRKGDADHDPRMTEVVVAKQRNGPTGTVPMLFLKEQGRFEMVARRPSEMQGRLFDQDGPLN